MGFPSLTHTGLIATAFAASIHACCQGEAIPGIITATLMALCASFVICAVIIPNIT